MTEKTKEELEAQRAASRAKNRRRNKRYNIFQDFVLFVAEEATTLTEARKRAQSIVKNAIRSSPE